MRLQHPHDRFVREFFGEPAHAREFLSAVLPAALADTLDCSGNLKAPTSSMRCWSICSR